MLSMGHLPHGRAWSEDDTSPPDDSIKNRRRAVLWHDQVHHSVQCDDRWGGFVPKRTLTVMTWLVASLAVTLATGCGASKETGTWGPLRYKTGWIRLGYLVAGTENWATQGVYRPVGAASDATSIPKAGDVLEITKESLVIIVEFKSHGEDKRLTSPASRLLYEDDSTDINLPPGEQVRVQETQRGAAADGVQMVWARVEPINAPAP